MSLAISSSTPCGACWCRAPRYADVMAEHLQGAPHLNSLHADPRWRELLAAIAD
jgi:hypothetical protein